MILGVGVTRWDCGVAYWSVSISMFSIVGGGGCSSSYLWWCSGQSQPLHPLLHLDSSAAEHNLWKWREDPELIRYKQAPVNQAQDEWMHTSLIVPSSVKTQLTIVDISVLWVDQILPPPRWSWSWRGWWGESPGSRSYSFSSSCFGSQLQSLIFTLQNSGKNKSQNSKIHFWYLLILEVQFPFQRGRFH